MKKNIKEYATILYNDEGMVSVRIPDFDIATFGVNEADAIDMAKEAVSLYMDVEQSIPAQTAVKDVVLEDWEADSKAKITLVSYDTSWIDEESTAFAYA